MLKELIDNHYIDRQTYDKERNYFYISEAGKCPRAIYFSFKKYPKKEKDPRTLRIFDHGDYVHMRITGTLFSMGIVRAAEIDIPKKELIHGRADVIISIDNENYLVDIKSINKGGFSNLYEPNSDHIKQIQLYLHYFNIKKGILLYECKDTQEIKEFLITYDPLQVETLLNDFKQLKDQISSEILPQKTTDEWRCSYCDYADICQKADKGILEKPQAIPTTEEKLPKLEAKPPEAKPETKPLETKPTEPKLETEKPLETNISKTETLPETHKQESQETQEQQKTQETPEENEKKEEQIKALPKIKKINNQQTLYTTSQS